MSAHEKEPTLGDLYDRLSEEDRKRAFFFLFQITEFYANPDTWFAVTIIGDPPCGNGVRDYRLVPDGKHRPGGRARLALSWIVSNFKRML